MDIVISVNNNEEVMVLPIVPPDIEIDNPWENEEKDSLQLGKVNLIGLPGLRTLSISSFFPVDKKYPFQKSGSEKDGEKYVDFFARWRVKRVPFRIIITGRDMRQILNMPVTVEDFKYAYDKVGDIKYTIDLKEYRFVV